MLMPNISSSLCRRLSSTHCLAGRSTGCSLGCVGTDAPTAERASLIDTARSTPDAWTLVLLVGQSRTVDFTVSQLAANVLLPNEPCHVSVALDAKPWWFRDNSGWRHSSPARRMPAHARAVLSPWLISETTGSPCGGASCAHVEFRLTLQALEQGVAAGRRRGVSYSWLISSRTDLYIDAPVCVKALHGRVGDSTRFESLVRRLDKSLPVHHRASELPGPGGAPPHQLPLSRCPVRPPVVYSLSHSISISSRTQPKLRAGLAGAHPNPSKPISTTLALALALQGCPALGTGNCSRGY